MKSLGAIDEAAENFRNDYETLFRRNVCEVEPVYRKARPKNTP